MLSVKARPIRCRRWVSVVVTLSDPLTGGPARSGARQVRSYRFRHANKVDTVLFGGQKSRQVWQRVPTPNFLARRIGARRSCFRRSLAYFSIVLATMAAASRGAKADISPTFRLAGLFVPG